MRSVTETFNPEKGSKGWLKIFSTVCMGSRPSVIHCPFFIFIYSTFRKPESNGSNYQLKSPDPLHVTGHSVV